MTSIDIRKELVYPLEWTTVRELSCSSAYHFAAQGDCVCILSKMKSISSLFQPILWKDGVTSGHRLESLANLSWLQTLCFSFTWVIFMPCV